MGTSNWQNIPFCVDALMKMEPRRVLDIGVGFGRWGILIREFCEVWFNKVHATDWDIDIQGVEAFEPNIEDHQRLFYSKIHIGDAADLLPGLDGPWDVILYGDVLEHFKKDVALKMLETSLDRSAYVMVNIPLGEEWEQEEMYGNPYEAHLSEWTPEEFRQMDLVREETFLDFSGRPFGVFILSRKDPKDVRGSLFSKTSGGAATPSSALLTMDEPELRDAMLRTEHRIRELGFEVDFLKGMRPVRKLLRKPARVVRALGRWKKCGIELKALGQKNEQSTGTEVALLGARSEAVYAGLPWYLMDADPNWVLRKEPKGLYGHALITDEGGAVRLVLRGHQPRLLLRRGPNAGKVQITRRGHTRVIDLYARVPDLLDLSPKRDDGEDDDAAAFDTHWASAEADQTLESLGAGDSPVLAVTVDGWLGVSNSTRTLFERTLVLTHRLTDSQVEHWARRIVDAGARHVVLSGVCPAHLDMARRIKALDGAVRVDALWHGSYMQAREDYAWSVFQQLVRAAREGHITRIGVVKRGMERWLQGLGLASELVLNYVPQIPAGPSKTDEGGPHVGVWLSNENYRKLPFAMLAAVSMIPGGVVRGAGLSERSLEFLEFLEVAQDRVSTTPLPSEELQVQMGRCHVNLYVTASECCPMLPLESLAVGAPCLVAPNSHLFEDDEFLHSRLVVPRPDEADTIAEYARRAIAERDAILEAYRRYGPGYIERARSSVRRFLAG